MNEKRISDGKVNEGKMNRSHESWKNTKHINLADEDAPNWKEFPKQMKKLEEEGIYPLKKKSNKFPKARYFCRLCDYHCDTVDICKKHAVDSRHVRLKESKILEKTLSFLPDPNLAQYEAITELIEKEVEIHGTTKEDLEVRMKIKEELEKELQNVVPKARLQVSGSTLSEFALKSSNLDLDIEILDDGKLSSGLLAIKKIVESSKDRFTNVVNHLSTSYPSMSFTHNETGVRTVVGISKSSAWKTNNLLYYYNTLDERVKPLTMIFKYWAKLCSISNQHEGALSSHCFPIMMIHFLQQTTPPVLPVLQMIRDPKLGDFEAYCRPDELDPPWKSANTCSLGELWIQMFRYYAFKFKSSIYVITVRNSVPFVRTESRWGKKLAIEDPFQTKRNMTHTVSSSSVFDFIANNFRSTYKYFVIPQLKFGCLFKSLRLEPNDLSLKKCSLVEIPESDGEEDPDKAPPPVEEEEEESGEIVNGVSGDKEEDREEEQEVEESELQDEHILCDLKDLSLLSEPDDDGKKNSTNGEIDEDTTPTPTTPSVDVAEKKDLPFLDINYLTESLGEISPDLARHLISQITKDMLNYRFVKEIFTGGEFLPLFCTACQRSGHTKLTCLEDELPPLAPLPPLKQSYFDLLSTMFYDLKNECSPSPKELWERDHLVDELQGYIKQFYPNAVLKLFGSSANGFGFGNSDLDICMTFQGETTGEGIDHIKIIEELAEKLKKFRECRLVLAITTAKVPIVKFSLKRAHLEADLSLYNTLALQNTKLLSAYAAIDFRVKVLGYAIKYFAKICNIGDASRGSLSSYAYILMALHYLQQCNPPVIPVLQKLHDPDKPRPELQIDGWDAWFYEDINKLNKVWPDYKKNKQSVGELWVNLLRYYTEKFDWKENVITIRQAEPLSKLEKLWTSKCIAIEDPFDLGHNLGGGLSRNMNAFILKAFIKGRAVFGYGFERAPRGYPHLGLFLFDRDVLTDGAPPNDRGCRWCGCIGHMVKDCPRKLLRKERNREDRKDNPGSPANNASPLQPKPQNKSLSVPPPPPLTSNKKPATVETSTHARKSTTSTAAATTSAGAEKTSSGSTKKPLNKDVTCVPKAKRKMKNGGIAQEANVKDKKEKRPATSVSRPQEVSTTTTFGPSPSTEATSSSSSSSPSCSSHSSSTASQTDAAAGSSTSPAPLQPVEGSEITPSLLFRLASQTKSGSLVLPSAANLPKGIPPPPPGFSNQPNPPGNFPWGNTNLSLGVLPSAVSGMVFGPSYPFNQNLSSSPDREKYRQQLSFPSQIQARNSPQSQSQKSSSLSSQQHPQPPFSLNQLTNSLQALSPPQNLLKAQQEQNLQEQSKLQHPLQTQQPIQQNEQIPIQNQQSKLLPQTQQSQHASQTLQPLNQHPLQPSQSQRPHAHTELQPPQTPPQISLRTQPSQLSLQPHQQHPQVQQSKDLPQQQLPLHSQNTLQSQQQHQLQQPPKQLQQQPQHQLQHQLQQQPEHQLQQLQQQPEHQLQQLQQQPQHQLQQQPQHQLQQSHLRLQQAHQQLQQPQQQLHQQQLQFQQPQHQLQQPQHQLQQSHLQLQQPQPQHSLPTQFQTQQQVQMFEQHAQMQQQLAQQQFMLQFQQMQLRARNLQPPNFPTKPLDGNSFISHVMGRGQETPSSVGSSLGMWMTPPPPPGLVPGPISSQTPGGPNYPSNFPLQQQNHPNLHQVNMGLGLGNPNQFPDVVKETILAGADSSQFNQQLIQHTEFPLKHQVQQNVPSLPDSQELTTATGDFAPGSVVEDCRSAQLEQKRLSSANLQETNVESEF